ncbi:cupin domain-containing protein [Spirosoma endophyticum]|uniref:Cupin domain-containing protein n=1 Tax=Spirosoma endophyticum TaxID=662367 RepID=A0A1I2CGJ8_9BACT|nr:cupin domain-containing protein [Spirosoma endophyticum]SFE66933.1 Cupin domain-containing protein [Spirosoma endophyticum]
MKRNSFLKACLGTGTFLISPFVLAAKTIKNYRVEKGFKVDAGKDRFDHAISLFEGDTFTTKVSTKDTDGDIYVYESRREKEGGPALHTHFNQDEMWYVLEGEFLIKVGDVVHQAKTGDSVFGPRNVPHCFAKVGPGEGRLLMTFQPAGKMEVFFQKVSEGALKTMSEAEQDKFREEHGFKRVGPPINQLKK